MAVTYGAMLGYAGALAFVTLSLPWMTLRVKGTAVKSGMPPTVGPHDEIIFAKSVRLIMLITLNLIPLLWFCVGTDNDVNHWSFFVKFAALLVMFPVSGWYLAWWPIGLAIASLSLWFGKTKFERALALLYFFVLAYGVRVPCLNPSSSGHGYKIDFVAQFGSHHPSTAWLSVFALTGISLIKAVSALVRRKKYHIRWRRICAGYFFVILFVWFLYLGRTAWTQSLGVPEILTTVRNRSADEIASFWIILIMLLPISAAIAWIYRIPLKTTQGPAA